jgi:hypothetical protein
VNRSTFATVLRTPRKQTMTRTALLALALLAAACGGPAMDGPAVDPGPTPDMGTDSAPSPDAGPAVPSPDAAPPVPGPDAAPPVTVATPDAAPDAGKAPDSAPPRADAAPPSKDAAAPVVDAGPTGPAPICNSPSQACVSAQHYDDLIRATFPAPCAPNALSKCGGLEQMHVVETILMTCKMGAWRLAGVWTGSSWVGDGCSRGCASGQICDP